MNEVPFMGLAKDKNFKLILKNILEKFSEDIIDFDNGTKLVEAHAIKINGYRTIGEKIYMIIGGSEIDVTAVSGEVEFKSILSQVMFLMWDKKDVFFVPESSFSLYINNLANPKKEEVKGDYYKDLVLVEVKDFDWCDKGTLAPLLFNNNELIFSLPLAALVLDPKRGVVISKSYKGEPTYIDDNYPYLGKFQRENGDSETYNLFIIGEKAVLNVTLEEVINIMNGYRFNIINKKEFEALNNRAPLKTIFAYKFVLESPGNMLTIRVQEETVGNLVYKLI